MPIYLLLLFVAVSLTGKDTPSASAPGPRVQTQTGMIEGTTNKSGTIRIFKGIPFARPPVGALRWKAPQPPASWEGVRDCKQFSASPMQNEPNPFMFWSEEFLIPKEPISEDCLYLNVWSGAKESSEKRPVLVYIYGGGFVSGGSACPIYDGEAMARKGVVFVSINYRVGVFGFLAYEELSAESGYGTSGNYGLLDMIAALKWVQKNIAAFGGDPQNVCIAGQSAGAFGVNYLTASPLARNLFHKAIAQSGGSFFQNTLRPSPDLTAAEEMGEKFAEGLGCTTLKELRNKSAAEIQNAEGAMANSVPLVDGYLIPVSIFDAYSSGKQNDVPMLIGWNKDDIVMGPPQSAEVFRSRMEKELGEEAEDFFTVYPCQTEAEARQSQFDLGRDQTFGFQVFTWANMQSRTGESPVYVYNFNRDLPAYDPETAFGAFHSGEIVYAYDNLHTLDRPWEEVDSEIADLLSTYWVNFAQNGDPNGSSIPNWSVYVPGEDAVMLIDTVSKSATLPSLGKMKFWEQHFNQP